MNAGPETGGRDASETKPQMEKDTRLTLEAAGITLIGVILSIGLTVGFGVNGPVWLKVLAGVATAAVLVAAVKAGSSQTAGLRRAANWITRTKPSR